MNALKIESITPDQIFSEQVFLDNDFLLLPGGCSFTDEQIKDLNEWGFKQVFTSGKTASTKAITEQIKKDAKTLIQTAAANKIDSHTEEVDVSAFIQDEDAAPAKPAVKKESDNKAEPAAPKKEEPATEKSENTASTINEADFEKAKETYFSFIRYIDSVYTFYATNKEFNLDEIAQKMNELCNFVSNNRRYVLRIISTPSMSDKNFLVNHSIRSTIVAITVGLQLKFPQDKLRELAIACMLHEIGMILLPPQLYMNDKQLSNPEKLMMNTHPIVSYNILRKANFSINIQLAVLEHHERMNGSGYPRHVTGAKISIYAKIIALACSFEAITAPREYKDERTSFEALVELLRNSNHQYDDIVTKALLYSISLYPIGVYVYLSNGKIAQVVDVSEGNPKTPFVQVIGETDEKGNAKIIQVDTTKLKIIRVLNKKEVDDTLNALKKTPSKA